MVLCLGPLGIFSELVVGNFKSDYLFPQLLLFFLVGLTLLFRLESLKQSTEDALLIDLTLASTSFAFPERGIRQSGLNLLFDRRATEVSL